MITVAEAFQKFRGRLELTKREQEDASRRQTTIREFLCAKFERETDFLTGSYARWTKTKPLKDVDIFFVLGGKDASYRNYQPETVLGKFREVLGPEFGEAQVHLGRRSVQIGFGIKVVDDSSNDQVMSIDVVPAVNKNSHYEIPDRVTGRWIPTDPEVHAELATKANKGFSEEWKPLVKMVKKWNETNGGSVKPTFLLEVMALEIFVPPFSGGYPYELKGFFATVADRIADVWQDPAKLGPPVSDQMNAAAVHGARAALRRAEEMVGRAIRLDRDGRVGDALQEWRRIFGPLFPLS